MTTAGNDKELEALIKLIDEPDEVFFSRIREKILSYGTEATPLIQKALDSHLETGVHERLQALLTQIRKENTREDLKNWLSLGSSNLLLGIIIIARLQYPDLEETEIKTLIDRIKQDVWLELNDDQTALEKIKTINVVLFDIYKFEGNRTSFHSPSNFFINQILETRRGSPIGLALVYLLITSELGYPVYGINLPEHFILAWADEKITTDIEKPEDRIIFYINPYSKGSLFTRREIDLFLAQIKIQPEKEFYLPCTNADIVLRLIRNLIYSYGKLGQNDTVRELENLLDLFGAD